MSLSSRYFSPRPLANAPPPILRGAGRGGTTKTADRNDAEHHGTPCIYTRNINIMLYRFVVTVLRQKGKTDVRFVFFFLRSRIGRRRKRVKEFDCRILWPLFLQLYLYCYIIFYRVRHRRRRCYSRRRTHVTDRRRR